MTNSSATTADQPLRTNQLHAEDEIDLRQVAGALIRRWAWIVSGTAVGLTLSGHYVLTTKPVYQAEFQIVLSQAESQTGVASLFSQNPGLAALTGLGNSGGNTIATEVQILNSPSVLRPVFDAVKARKSPEVAMGLRFQSWARSAISAEAERAPRFEVQYRDTDKKLVLPITRMIQGLSKLFQPRPRS